MEIKEALGIIEERISFTIGNIDGVIIDGVIGEAMDTIKNEVERQTPKKVVTKQRFLLDKFCPNCDENLTNFGCYSLNSWKYRYCAYCGQRLKWGD